MPRAANASPPEHSPLTVARAGYPPDRRLRKPAQFAVVVGREGRPAGTSWQGGRRYLAVQARVIPMALIDLASSPTVDVEADRRAPSLAASAAAECAKGPRVRFGITVGKRNARRAVERSLIKRVLRESARHAAAELDAAAGSRRVDIVLRLKAPCPPVATLTRPLLKRALRSEADALLAQLTAVLRRDPTGVSA